MALKSNWYRKYMLDVLIAFTIAVLPFLGYAHLLFSNDHKTILLFGIEYSHIFLSNSTFVWYLMKSIIPFTLLLIWFITISMRWKYLIVPLFILYLKNILNNLFDLFRDYSFYPIYDNHALTIKIILISTIIIILFFWDFYYFKHYRKRLLEISIKSIVSSNIRNSNNIYRENLESLIKTREKITQTSYLQKIYNVKLILENRLNRHTRPINDLVNAHRDRLNVIVVCLLVFTTFLWFMHYLIPENEQVWDLGIIQLDNNGFLNVRIYIWFLLQKLIILIPLVLWFISCQQWWKYAILSPIILYSFQFWEATQDVNSLDAAGNIKAFPAIFCVVLLLLMISKAIKYRVEILIMYEHLAEEIEDLLKNADFNANSVLCRNVKRFKKLKEDIAQETNAKQQLMKLIDLRNELVKQLKINY